MAKRSRRSRRSISRLRSRRWKPGDDSMSLSSKLMTGVGVTLGVALLSSAGAILAIRDLNRELEHAAKITARKQYLAGEANAAATEMSSLERGGVLAAVLGDKVQSELYQTRFRASQNELKKAVEELRQ